MRGVFLLLALAGLAQAEPTVSVTILDPTPGKACDLATQLSALQPARGRLLVHTHDAAPPASDFAVQFSWLPPADVRSSNATPLAVAADPEPARRALAAAMAGSYPTDLIARLQVEVAPPTGHTWSVIFPAPRSGVSLARQFRVARRLVAAQLAERDLLPPVTGTWPHAFRPTRALALYDAEGVGYSGSQLLRRAVEDTTLDAAILPVCPEDIREGILDRCAGVLFPGGSGKGIATALHPDGVQRVRDFVAAGGGYFGVCAGAYFAAAGLPVYAGMVPLKHDQPWAKGRGRLDVGLTDEGRALFGPDFGRFETPYNCGPVFRDLASDGSPAPVTVLARFLTPVRDKKGVARDEMVDTPAILSMAWRKGRIMMISPHPEAVPAHRLLVARAIAWTIGADPLSVTARPP